MKIFGYVSSYFDSGTIVKLRDESGFLISCFETRLHKTEKIIEVAKKFAPKEYEFEWIDNPHSNAGLRILVSDYEKHVGVSLTGHEIKERWSF